MKVQRIVGTYNGIPCEILASWSESRDGYEVVFSLNPEALPGCTHKTLLGVSEQVWEIIKLRVQQSIDVASYVEYLEANLDLNTFQLNLPQN